jgi:NAD dependent epimerase/dehydratase family enzyme
LGEAADSLLASQRVHPAQALAAPYRFHFTDLEPALSDLFGGA